MKAPPMTTRDDLESLPERLRVNTCRYGYESEDDASKRRIATDLEAADALEAKDAEIARLSEQLERVARVDNSLAKQLSVAMTKNADLEHQLAEAQNLAFEDAARICDNWIGTFGHVNIKYTPAREYAVDAIEDIAEILRSPTQRAEAASAIAAAIRGGAE